MNNQRESVRKICAALNKHQVDFLLIGGMAVAYHGFERSTEDVDFWYKPSTENFHRLIAALADLKVDVTELTGLIFDPKKAYIRIPSLGLLAEFLPQLAGLTYQSAKSNAIQTTFEGEKIFVIGLDDLIKNKNQVGRPKDLLDVAELEKRQKPR